MSDELFTPRAAAVVRVALPVPVNTLFDYAVSSELVKDIEIGSRVRVPLEGRHLTGIIVERVTPIDPNARLRFIDDVLDPEAILPASLVMILIEAASEALCPVGIALATALPPNNQSRWERVIVLTDRGLIAHREKLVEGRLGQLLSELAIKPQSEKKIRNSGNWSAIATGLTAKLLKRTTLKHPPRASARRKEFVHIAKGVDLKTQLNGPLSRAPVQAALLERIALNGPLPAVEIRAESSSSGSALRALHKRKMIIFEQRLSPRNILQGHVKPDVLPELNGAQLKAVSEIQSAIQARESRTFLLHGVTGSGKTEVYLRAISDSLKLGRQALVLVPEITLTHQLVSRLRARFGDELAILHSKLTPGERIDQWLSLRNGQNQIAVGARSALFAPLDNLGVIIIDEEHDPAYKNADGFRYQARDLAKRRAEVGECPLILGSATPSLETRYEAERGRFNRLVLPDRIAGHPLPAVELVDMVHERASIPRGRKLVLSRPLVNGLRDVLEDGGQAILFLNRRGFATQIACFACGHVEHCRQCDIALVYHALSTSLICHYCDFRCSPPDICRACGSEENALLGVGTERVEEDVRIAFPTARVARLDRDTTSQRGATENLLNKLKEKQIDIMVGTQMVAKGHDYPGVRLVGVIHAELALHLPDFRAAERCFQLLTQVAGRAGRGHEPGRVIVQTFLPNHYALQPVLTHDYETFYGIELNHRRDLGYPPFGSIAQIIVSAQSEREAQKGALVLAKTGLRTANSDVEVLGPSPAPLARIRGRFRFQIFIKGSKKADVLRVSRAIKQASERLSGKQRTSVDVSPQDML